MTSIYHKEDFKEIILKEHFKPKVVEFLWFYEFSPPNDWAHLDCFIYIESNENIIRKYIGTVESQNKKNYYTEVLEKANEISLFIENELKIKIHFPSNKEIDCDNIKWEDLRHSKKCTICEKLFIPDSQFQNNILICKKCQLNESSKIETLQYDLDLISTKFYSLKNNILKLKFSSLGNFPWLREEPKEITNLFYDKIMHNNEIDIITILNFNNQQVSTIKSKLEEIIDNKISQISHVISQREELIPNGIKKINYKNDVYKYSHFDYDLFEDTNQYVKYYNIIEELNINREELNIYISQLHKLDNLILFFIKKQNKEHIEIHDIKEKFDYVPENLLQKSLSFLSENNCIIVNQNSVSLTSIGKFI